MLKFNMSAEESRKSRTIKFQDIPVNQYNKTIETKANFSADNLCGFTAI